MGKMQKPHCSPGVVFLTLVMLFIEGCFATTNYYTGKTLEKGKLILSPGLDYIAFSDASGKLRFNKHGFAIPSFGASYGLPWKAEIGLRWIGFMLLEGNVRWQMNPRKFRWVDVSTNLHLGYLIRSDYPYLKTGVTISRDIGDFVLFFSSYWYAWKVFDPKEVDPFNTNPVLAFGIGIPHKENMIIPEINYFPPADAGKGAWFLSVGFRVPQRKKDK